MKEFKNSNMFDGSHGPGGGSGGGGFHGPGAGSGGGGFHGQGHPGNQGGYNQQPDQNNQQQQPGYQSNPKQLNSVQYHVFTTSLCKRDQKLHKMAVNAVEPAIPHYLRWSQ